MSPAKRKGAMEPRLASPCNAAAALLNRAVARGGEITVRTVGGGSYGPARVREKVSRLPVRDGASVGVRLEGMGDPIHLADVASIAGDGLT